MPIDLYVDTVFAVDGDLTTVPDALDPSGYVSFDQGYPIGYEITPGDPGSLPIERGKMNYLFNQAFGAIQYLQRHSTNFFITSTMNGGTPYSYSKYDRVLQGGVVYQSLSDTNTQTPPDTNWAIPNILSSSGTSILKGDGLGGISNASAGTDYLAPNGNGSALTGITASQVSGLPLTKSYTSGDQTITLGGLVTLSHGMSLAPKIISVFLVCQTSDQGYSPGDVVTYNPAGDGNNSSGANSITVDSSNLSVRYQAAAPYVGNKANGVNGLITTANWKMRFLAFA